MFPSSSLLAFALSCALVGQAVPIPSSEDSTPTVLGIAGATLDASNQAVVDAKWTQIQSHVLNGDAVSVADLANPNPSNNKKKIITNGRHLASNWFAAAFNRFSITGYQALIPGWSASTFANAQTSLANVPFPSGTTSKPTVQIKSLFVDSTVSSFGFAGKWDAAKIESVCKAALNVGLVQSGGTVPAPPAKNKGYSIEATSLGFGKLCIGFTPSSCFPVSVKNTAAAAGDECDADASSSTAPTIAVPVTQPGTDQTGATTESTEATTGQTGGASGQGTIAEGSTVGTDTTGISSGTKRPAPESDDETCTGTVTKKVKVEARRRHLDFIFRRAPKAAVSTVGASCPIPIVGKTTQTTTPVKPKPIGIIAPKGTTTTVKPATGKTVPVTPMTGKTVAVKATTGKVAPVKSTKATASTNQVKTPLKAAAKGKAAPVQAKTAKKIKA